MNRLRSDDPQLFENRIGNPMATKRRLFLLAILGLVGIVLVISVVAFQLRSGIRVTIENTGRTPLKAVVLHVRGASYNLGDIAPGASANVRVKATGESSLEIEFEDADGTAKILDAEVYLESSYWGTIRVSIKGGEIDKNEQDIKLHWLSTGKDPVLHRHKSPTGTFTLSSFPLTPTPKQSCSTWPTLSVSKSAQLKRANIPSRSIRQQSTGKRCSSHAHGVITEKNNGGRIPPLFRIGIPIKDFDLDVACS